MLPATTTTPSGNNPARNGRRNSRRFSRTRAIGAGLAVAGLLFTAACSGEAEGGSGGGLFSSKGSIATDLVLSEAILTEADTPGLKGINKQQSQAVSDVFADAAEEAGEGSFEEGLDALLDGFDFDPPECSPLNFSENPDFEKLKLDDPLKVGTDDPDYEYTMFLKKNEGDEGEAPSLEEEQTPARTTLTLSRHNIFYNEDWYTSCPSVTTTMEDDDIHVELHDQREIEEFDLPDAENVLAVKSTSQATYSLAEFGLEETQDSQEYWLQAQVGPYYITVEAEGPESAAQAKELMEKQVEKLHELSASN